MTAITLNTSAIRLELSGPDSPGEDAILLVESLIHGLVEKSLIDVTEAVDIVGTATQVKEEIVASRGDSAATQKMSLARLEHITTSLEYDLPR